MVLVHRRFNVRESVVSILNDHWIMRKLFARWVPPLLTVDHNCNRGTTSKDCFQPCLGRDFASFRCRGQNMNSPEQTGNQAAVQIVGFCKRIGAEVGVVSVIQQRHGDIFFGMDVVQTSYWDALTTI